jgi:hypothetical protein
MPVTKTNKKRRKKIRYSEVSLKLSRNQQRSLDNYCKARRTTRTKLIKKMIRPFLSYYSKEIPEGLHVTATQLDLFGTETQKSV